MGKPKIPPPSIIDFLSFPVFGLAWYGTPSTGSVNSDGGDNNSGGTKKNPGISALAYCGGGGSSKTGVFNKIAVVITTDFDNGGSRQLEISTGEALCFGIHLFRPYDDVLNMVRLVATVGDEVFLYGIPIFAPEGEEKEEAILLGKHFAGQGYGAGVTTYTPIHRNGSLVHCIAVGCENGMVILYQLKQQQNSVEIVPMAECAGHTKAICSLAFHPRGMQILSSAKDGTARVFSTEDGKQLALMECEVHNPKEPPPPKPVESSVKDPRMRKKPLQIIVRGCAYGDLEGKTIYTVASDKRSPAYLTKWKEIVPLASAPPGEANLSFRQEYRIQCSPVPVSACSISSDGTLFAFGTTEGNILLYNLETNKVLKSFQAHDLPVTCVAARPIPNVLMLPGELEGGVNYDAISASADNRLGRWTLQKRSRIQSVRQRRSKREMSALESLLWNMFRIPLLVFVIIVLIAIHDVMDLCGEEVGLNALMRDFEGAGRCVWREVLWAEDTRAGVRSVPE